MTVATFPYPGHRCPKCDADGLEAEINSDAGTITITCWVCYAHATQDIGREAAEAAIAERKKVSRAAAEKS